MCVCIYMYIYLFFNSLVSATVLHREFRSRPAPHSSKTTYRQAWEQSISIIRDLAIWFMGRVHVKKCFGLVLANDSCWIIITAVTFYGTIELWSRRTRKIEQMFSITVLPPHVCFTRQWRAVRVLLCVGRCRDAKQLLSIDLQLLQRVLWIWRL